MKINRIKQRIWMKTYWGQYYVAAYLATGPLAFVLTEGTDYGQESWTLGDCFVMVWIFGIIGGIGAAIDLTSQNKKKKYKANLDKHSHIFEQWIEAKPDVTTGYLDVYEKTRSVNGETLTQLRRFHPEEELEECLDFVNSKRAAIASKKLELAPAKRVAKLINEDK